MVRVSARFELARVRVIGSRLYQQRVIDVEMGSFTPLVFWHERRNGEGMKATFARKTASRMPVPYLVLKQAHLLKFLRSFHTYVRCEVPDPLFTRMLNFWMILVLMPRMRTFLISFSMFF